MLGYRRFGDSASPTRQYIPSMHRNKIVGRTLTQLDTFRVGRIRLCPIMSDTLLRSLGQGGRGKVRGKKVVGKVIKMLNIVKK